jgi:hypothetical protein
MSGLDEFISKATTDQSVVPEESGIDKWASGADETARLGSAVSLSENTQPETAARILKLKEKTGLPDDMIERNLDALEKDANRSDFDPVSFRRTNPVVASWMAENPTHAALVKDDLKEVQALEGTIEDFSFGQTLWRSLNSGLARTWANTARVPAFAYNTLALPQNLLAKAVGRPDAQVKAPDWLMNNSVAKKYDQLAESYKVKELDQSIVGYIQAGDYAKAGRTLAVQFAANAPNQAELLLMAWAGLGTPALVTMGAQQGAAVNKESQDSGADPAQAALNAAFQGTIEASFESIGTFGLFKTWEKQMAKAFGKGTATEVMKGFAKTMAATALGEGNEEFLTQIAQDFSDFVTGVNPDAMKGTMQRAMDAGLVGAASGGGTTTLAAAASGFARAQEIRRVEQAKNFYLALGASAEASKLRERLPAAQKQIVERMVKDTPVENIYIPVEAMEEHFQGAKINPVAAARDIGIEKEYSEAKQTGGDIKIPLATWAEKVVGTDHYKALADDIKFDPNDMTANQMKLFQEQIKAEEAKQKEEVEIQEPAQNSEQQMLDDVVGQLKATGMDEQTARTSAAVFSGFRVLAERMGIDPTALYERYGLKINKAEALQEPGLEQKPLEESEIVNPIDRNLPQPEKVQALVALSQQNAPEVESFLRDVDQELNSVSKYSYKDPEKILRKANRPSIKSIKPWFDVEHVRDSLRFKSEVDNMLDFGKIVQRAVARGWEIVKLDMGKVAKPKEWGWRFGGMDIRMPNGQIVEYYFYPKELAGEVKDKNHDLFEKWRESTEEYRYEHAAEYMKDLAESRQRYGEAWQKYLERNGQEESAFLASWASLETSLASLTGSKLSLRSSGENVPLRQAPPSNTAPITGSSDSTMIRPESGSLDASIIGEPPNSSIAPVPDDVKALFQPARPTAPVFFSAAARAISEKMPTKTTPEQVLGILKGTPGVKQEEIDWIGLPEFLKGKKSVSKEDVQSFIAQNQVQIREIVKGEVGGEVSKAVEAEAERLQEKAIDLAVDAMMDDYIIEIPADSNVEPIESTDEERISRADAGLPDMFGAERKEVPPEAWRVTFEGEEIGIFDTEREAQDAWDDEMNQYEDRMRDYAVGEFRRYAENENPIENFYDEARAKLGDKAEEPNDQGMIRGGEVKYKGYKLPGGDNYREILFALPEQDEDYRSPHWDEQNVIAHVRIDDRADLSKGGRVLFIEEIQSDWHQAGRREGYKNGVTLRELKKKIDTLDDERQKIEDDRLLAGLEDKDAPPAVIERWTDLKHEIRKLTDEYSRIEREGVPNAPFKKSWHELVLKRMLRYAAENGYDKIAWTTGNQQADRYDLSKQVTTIRYYPTSSTLQVFTSSRRAHPAVEQTVEPKELENMLGKEVAAKLLATKAGEDPNGPESDSKPEPVHILGGVDLKIGGEGMKGFYDKIIPAFLNKYAKKWGGKVSETIFGSTPVHSLEITPSMKESVTFEGQPLFQGSDEGPRGMLRFGANRQFNIDLFKNADLSTFLHETGHLYLEVLGDLAADSAAPAQIKDDYQAILKHLGVESRDQIKRMHHEQFARMFEAYLMEGKAPSAGLRAAFARFRAWLIAIYKQVANLKVELNPEVRAVFDRLLASDQEIAAAQNEAQVQPLFADPASVGMTATEAENYTRAVGEAKRAAEEELSSKIMRQWDRARKSWWNEKREGVKKEIAAEVSKRREYAALDALSKKDNELPPGVHPMRLSRSAIENEFPDFELKNLPRIYTREGGVHPDVAAEVFGYRSGSELLFDLETAEDKEVLIERTTDEKMKELYGDILTDGTLAVEAVKAVHNDKRSLLLHKELEHLASSNLAALKNIVRRVARPIPTVEAVREQAAEIVNVKRVRDLTPSLYQRAEAKANKEAIEAMLAGDLDAAFQAKQRELLNHELFRAATKAQEETDSIVNYLSKFNREPVRDRMGKAGADYLEQIDRLLDRFDFRRGTTLKSIDKAKSLMAWMMEQEAAGQTVDIPEKILNEAYRQSYKETSYGDLSDLRDTIKNIEHLAILKNKLLASARARDMQAARDEITAAIASNHDLTSKPIDLAPSLEKRLAEKAKLAIAEHTRMEFFFEFLDGEKKRGVVWEYFFKPVADSENKENDMRAADAKAFAEIFKEYTPKERARWFTEKIKVPELRNINVAENFTKSKLLAIALNWGNDYNREALLEGYGWEEPQVTKSLARLDARDWRLVQNLWDHIDTYWPQVAEQERRLNGVAPEKVLNAPFSIKTSDGTVIDLRGGYYPIVFDGKQSWRQSVLDEKASVKEMFGGNWARAMTRHGHTIERQSTGGKPLLLELNGLTNHISNVIHDLAYREAIIDINRLTNDPDIRGAIEAAAGREMAKQLNPWLHAIAGDKPREYTSVMEGFLGRARMGATVVNLGLKVTSSLMQTLGYTLTINEVGLKYAALGLRDAYGEPTKIGQKWEFITQRSKMMRDRMNNYDRDIRDYVRAPDFGLQSASWFMFVGYMDLATSMPSWLAAYRKSMDGHVENVEKGDERGASEYADSVVRTTQAAGSAKDNAAIQRGGEAFKLFTMFYSSMSILFNQFKKAGNQYVMDRNIPRLMGSLALIWFVPAVLEDMLRGKAPGSDDDDESVLAWLLKKEIFYPFSTVVLLRDVANAIERSFTSGRKDFDLSPITSAGESIVGLGQFIKNAVTDDDVTRTNVKDAVMTAGYFAQLPTRQVWLTAEYLYDWMTGEESPDSFPEGVYRALVIGKKRK